MKQTDAALVKNTLNGDKTAFGQLYDRYAKLVRVICYDTTGDWVTAQDLAQESFLRSYTKLNNLKDPDSFGPWLISITRNICREFRRGKFRDRHVLVGLEPPEKPSEENNPQNRLLSDMREALAKLSENERLALQVYYLQDNNAQQAQKILGLSRSGLYRLLEKARNKMQKYMAKQNNSD